MGWVFDIHDTYDWLLSPMRTKRDVIERWIKLVKFISFTKPSDHSRTPNQILLMNDDIKRFFVFSEKSHYSIINPFRVENNNGYLSFYSKTGIELDSETTSNMLSAIGHNGWLETGNVDEIYTAFELEEGADTNVWSIIGSLITTEDGYLRFDDDPNNADSVYHPQYHFDIFYSNEATFKIGARKKYSLKTTLEFLSSSTPVGYLEKMP